jgi:hypothetical protein
MSWYYSLFRILYGRLFEFFFLADANIGFILGSKNRSNEKAMRMLYFLKNVIMFSCLLLSPNYLNFYPLAIFFKKSCFSTRDTRP